MKRYETALASVGILFLVFVSTHAEGEAPEPRLALVVRPDAKEVASYEPLRVTVALRNVSAEQLKVDVSFLPTLQLTCTRADGSSTITVPGSMWGHYMGGTRDLAPGQEITSPERLFVFRKRGRHHFVFGEPGEYHVKVGALLGGRERIESEPVKVLVKPLPPDHASAAKLVTEVKAARMLQRWGYKEGTAALLEKLVSEFPHCLYADHVNYILGEYHSGKHLAVVEDNIPAARRGFRYYSAVSARIGAMRARALIRMAELVLGTPQAKLTDDPGELLRELKGYGGVAEAVGLGRNWRSSCTKLQALLAPPKKP